MTCSIALKDKTSSWQTLAYTEIGLLPNNRGRACCMSGGSPWPGGLWSGDGATRSCSAHQTSQGMARMRLNSA